MSVKRHTVLVLGPSREALSGVSTHVNLLFGSALAGEFDLVHFQVGSEGRREGPAARALRLAFGPLRLAAAIARRGARIVHINCSLNAKAFWRDLAHLAAAKLCGARVVFQKHGGELHAFAGEGLFARFVRAALGLADAIVVLSQAELRTWRAFLPGRRIAALPNCVDAAPYRWGRSRARRAREGGPLELIYLGRLVPAKGLDECLEAMKLETGRGAAVRLTLAGSGPEEARLRRRTFELGLTRHVRFAGPAYGEHKTELLCQADVLLLPSYAEGLPYALLEGMAAGLVPVATPVGAIPDVIADGAQGLLVPPRDAEAIADAVARLANDRAALLRMGAAARERVAGHYSLERFAAGFAALYREVGQDDEDERNRRLDRGTAPGA
jgi:glycosyltransferase involved in cell wall biosynthesis